MIRNTLMAAAVAVTAGIIAVPQASAGHRSWHDDDDVNLQFQFGIGTPGYYYGDPDFYHYPRYRISCGEARGILRDRNYCRIRTIECRGRTYTFRAIKNGKNRTVYVNSINGRVWRA